MIWNGPFQPLIGSQHLSHLWESHPISSRKKLLVQWPKNTTAHPAQWPQTQEFIDSARLTKYSSAKDHPMESQEIAVMIHESAIFSGHFGEDSFVPWSKVAILGMVIPPLIGILIMGPYKPLLFLPSFCQVAKSSGSRSDFKLSPVTWLTWSLVQSSDFAGAMLVIGLSPLIKNGILQMMSG